MSKMSLIASLILIWMTAITLIATILFDSIPLSLFGLGVISSMIVIFAYLEE